MKNKKITKSVFKIAILIIIIFWQNCACAQQILNKEMSPYIPLPFVHDQNWNLAPIFNDDFSSSNRYWKDNRTDSENKWRAYFTESGVTHGYPDSEHQIYQRENALFDTPSSGFLTLRATYHNPCVTDYWYPYWSPETDCFNYISGAIEAIQEFRYGYFEIRAKLPAPNCGNFPAFWLWGAGIRYSEIDIFEHTIWPDIPLSFKKFTIGYHASDGSTVLNGAYYLQTAEAPLTEFHTYAIEWSPKIIIWYLDGKVVVPAEYIREKIAKVPAFYDERITDQPMRLKVNYAIDNWKDNTTCHHTSLFPLDMVIDYVKVYKLNCDCNTPVTITNNTDLSAHSKSVKKNITVGTSSGTISIPNTGITLRATDEIIINSNFEVPLGSEFTAIVHDCPE